MDIPALEEKQILQMQRKMLVAKKERMERLIASIDRILKGEKTMDFEVFSKYDLEDMYNSMEANMSEAQKAVCIEQYGSMEAWKKSFLENAKSENAQENFKKVVEWYGSKEKALEAVKNPSESKNFSDYQKRLEVILAKLAEMKGTDVDAPEVKELVNEYDLVTKQMFRLPDATGMVLEMASAYQTNTEIQAAQDKIYGAGTTEFIGQAIEAFYKK